MKISIDNFRTLNCAKMIAAGHWGSTFEIQEEGATEDENSRNRDFDRAALIQNQLDETRLGWIREPQDAKKERYVDLGCAIIKWKLVKWGILSILIAFTVFGLPTIVWKKLSKHKEPVAYPDEYTVALHKALLFFNAQRSGRLPKSNGVSWRGNSGLKDGLKDVKGGLIGGYYDSGDNIKFHFPMAFSMTLLSWSAIEYNNKLKAIGEYDHIRDIIKWGTDYLLLTFNSSASSIDHIYSQVGVARNGSTTPDDHFCWQRPEDMNYTRPVEISKSAPDLGAEMAAALASASILFRDDAAYSKKLINGAKSLFEFSVNQGQETSYSFEKPSIDPFYNSTGFQDEIIWGAVWMYCATGNDTYLTRVSPTNDTDFKASVDSKVLSWDNKFPGIRLLLTRLRIFLNPGYPYEDTLRSYHDDLSLNMCSYLQPYHVFKWTPGGLIQLNHGQSPPLQYAANAAFLASLFADYMNATGIPGWYCGDTFFPFTDLRSFAASQVNYILGSNPQKMSYVVGYGQNYPKQVHHRGASIPSNHAKIGCREGWGWYRKNISNPNIITGAMVGGPDGLDRFNDVRSKKSSTEPTLAGNAGLVAALVSLTRSGSLDRNTIFSAVQPFFSTTPPPPAPWKP